MDRTREHTPVLIVDDDPLTVRVLREYLQWAGLRTAEANSLAAAREALDQHQPSLVLLDVNLGDGSGLDFCRMMQGNPALARTPVLFISADGDVTTKVMGFEAGAVDYITKPLAGGEVIARVRTHLRLRRANERLTELQAERIGRLAEAQQLLMPTADECQAASCQVMLRQHQSAGGDFYDIIAVDESITDYIVADASGHDLSASLWTAALKSLLSEYVSPLHMPAEVLTLVNAALSRFLPPGAFFTMVYARLNRRNGRLTLVNAGHPPALVLRAGEEQAFVVRQEGDVVGCWPDAIFGVRELRVRTRDRIFLYSDGLVEGDGQLEAGIEQLGETCCRLRGLPLMEQVPRVVQTLARGGNGARDDVLLMGVDV